MQQTTIKQNAFGSIVLERVSSRSSKNYRYLGNEYYQLSYPLRECISNYYPFGSSLPTRSWSDASRAYRYGFNGKEKDGETANDAYDFGARIYDGRLGRWLSVDPYFKMYPSVNSYNYVLNCPMYNIDLNGSYVTGNTLKFLNEVNAILCNIEGADVFISLLEVICITNQLAPISEEMFNKALLALGENEAAKALIRGYYYAINSPIKYAIFYIEDGQYVNEFAKDASEEFSSQYGNKSGLELNTLEVDLGTNFGSTPLIDQQNMTYYIFINHQHTNILKVKKKWLIVNGECVRPIPLPCISMVENPINSTCGLFYSMWKANDPFIISAGRCIPDNDKTPNNSSDPTNPIGPKSVGQEILKICQIAMDACDKYQYSIPEELKDNKDRCKQDVKIVTPPLMHRTSD